MYGDSGEFQQQDRSYFFLKKGRMEMLNMKIISEMKNSLDRLVNKLDTAEERISEFKYKSIEIIHTNTK